MRPEIKFWFSKGPLWIFNGDPPFPPTYLGIIFKNGITVWSYNHQKRSHRSNFEQGQPCLDSTSFQLKNALFFKLIVHYFQLNFTTAYMFFAVGSAVPFWLPFLPMATRLLNQLWFHIAEKAASFIVPSIFNASA